MAALGSGGCVDQDTETQQLDSHSFPSESGDKVDYWQREVPQGTLPMDEETQVIGGDTELGLYGETQLLEEDDDGMALFGKTQLLDQDEEFEGVEVPCDTQIVDQCNQVKLASDNSSEEGSQRTEVLEDSDAEDDGATPSAEEDYDTAKSSGPATTINGNAQNTMTELSDHPSEDGLSAPSDPRANEEGLPGPRGKSFSAVRTTSLRTSGYAATRKLTPKSSEIDESICNEKHTSNEKHSNFVEIKNRLQDVDSKSKGSECASVLDSEARDLPSKAASDLSDRNKCTHDDEMRHTTGNRRARKLFDDKAHDNEDKPASKADCLSGKVDPLQGFDIEFQDDFAPGLSYICSQEPGELTQASAFDIVDNLICVNEIVAAKNPFTGTSMETPFPAVTSIQGAQNLAKSTDRSPVRKGTTFDWVDANEDEGGGELFDKIRNSLSIDGKHLKKPRNQPKARLPLTGKNSIEDAKHKSTQLKTVSKALNLSFADSKVQANKRLKGSNQLASSNETPLINPKKHNGVKNDIHMDVSGTNGIGPDTQVAVEAMEALASGQCAEDMGEVKSIISDSTKSSKRSKLKRMPPKQAVSATYGFGSENSLRRSKRAKTADPMENGRKFSPTPNDLESMKGVDSAEKIMETNISDKMVATEQLPWSSVTRSSKEKKRPAASSFIKSRLSETSDVQACKTKSVGKRTRTARSQLFLNEKILLTHTSSPVTSQTRLVKEVPRKNDHCFNIGTEPEDNEKQDHTVSKDDAHACDSKYASPCHKPIDKGSPICGGLDPRLDRFQSPVRSSVARELIRLQTNEVTPPSVLQDSRRRREMSNICVLFSRHLDEDTIKHQKKILSRLGVPVATSISDATHFVADKFVRTRNLLEAMAVGKQIVTPMWVESCGQACCFIDEKNYILRDTKKEKEIGFSMATSLASACRKPLLQGKRVFITSNVKPDRETVSCLVKAAGGLPMERIARSLLNDATLLDDLLAISCEEDYAACTSLLEKGVEVFSSELILNGIVIQKLEYERHRLFLNRVRRTRSTLWLRSGDSNQFRPVGKRK